jgi:hypothetical protein
MGDAVHFEEAANMIRSMRADKHSGGRCEALEAFNKLTQYGARSHWAGGLQAADGTVFRFDDRSAFFLSDADRDCIKSSLTDAGWQDISTAPKDGTPIIGAFWSIRWADSHRKGDVVRCWYQPEFEAFISSCRQMTMAPGYTINGKESELHSPVVEPITHWMPLPAPPVGSQANLADATKETPL